MTAAIWPDWRATLADASASDWMTVLAYFLAAMIAARAACTAARRSAPRERRFWSFVTVLLLFLGFNELFDLQTALTAAGKELSLQQGWYEDRRVYQFEFVLALGVVAGLAGLAALWLTRATHRSVRWALFGLVFIAAFILVRAASFHHVDTLLGMGPSAFDLGSVQEMLGILIVGVAAHRYGAEAEAAKA